MVRHLTASRLRTRALFPPAALAQIQAACAAAEAKHEGEIRFAIETALPLEGLWHNLAPRARALQVFARLHMWDTRENNGVLIYVLRADRAVEIIADRGISAQVREAEWEAICRDVEAHYRAGRYVDGSLAAVASVARLIERHFPAGVAEQTQELPNQPILL
jgi:uncharacterized membrane protein